MEVVADLVVVAASLVGLAEVVQVVVEEAADQVGAILAEAILVVAVVVAIQAEAIQAEAILVEVVQAMAEAEEAATSQAVAAEDQVSADEARIAPGAAHPWFQSEHLDSPLCTG